MTVPEVCLVFVGSAVGAVLGNLTHGWLKKHFTSAKILEIIEDAQAAEGFRMRREQIRRERKAQSKHPVQH